MEELKRLRTRYNDPELQSIILEILSEFKNKKGNSIKKEYVREYSIRNHKKLLRMIYKDSQKKFKKFCQSINEDSKPSLLKFAKHAQENQSNLLIISKTEAGPATDGKSKRKNKSHTKKTFNDFFVRDYFSNPVVKESFLLYIKYKFSVFSPEDLCSSFKYYCCRGKKHGANCTDKWTKLLAFFEVYMFKDIEDRFANEQVNEDKDIKDFEEESNREKDIRLNAEGLMDQTPAVSYECKSVDRAVCDDEDFNGFMSYNRNRFGIRWDFPNFFQGANEGQDSQRNLVMQVGNLLNHLNMTFIKLASIVLK